MTKRISEDFTRKEFGDAEPDIRLLYILQWVRYLTGAPVIITSSTRTPYDMIKLYRDLEKRNKIKTLGNGLGPKSLLDVIPWGSRHLPCFENRYLRASDIECYKVDKTLYTGREIAEMIRQAVASSDYSALCEKRGISQAIGLGVGSWYCHLDIDREQDREWVYD